MVIFVDTLNEIVLYYCTVLYWDSSVHILDLLNNST